MSNSLCPGGLQYARPPCPSLSPRVYSNSCPLSVMPPKYLTLCRPLLLPSVFPSIKIFFHWVGSLPQVPKYWEFPLQHQSFNEYSGLTPFRIDWLDLLAVQGTPKNLFQHRIWKASILQQSSLWSNSHIQTWLLEKPQLWLYPSLLAKWCLCFLIHCLGLSEFFFQ